MSVPAPPSDLRAHLGYWLRMVSNAVSQGFARQVEDEGVTVAEWVVLRLLYDVERIAPTRLAGRMGMTRGAISKLADRLVAKGLVARTAGADDRRGHALFLAPAGRDIVPRLAALADRNDLHFFGGLEPGEREELRRLLGKIVAQRELGDVPTG